MDLGIGVGWLWEEFDVFGIFWKRWGVRIDEYVEVMCILWSGNSMVFDGEFVFFVGILLNFKLVLGNVFIVVGGYIEVAARRAGRLGDGFWPGGGDLGYLMDVMW